MKLLTCMRDSYWRKRGRRGQWLEEHETDVSKVIDCSHKRANLIEDREGPDFSQTALLPWPHQALTLALELRPVSPRKAVSSSSAPGTHRCFLQSTQPRMSLWVISMTSRSLPPKVILFYPLSETLSCIRARKLHPWLSLCAESRSGNVMS